MTASAYLIKATTVEFRQCWNYWEAFYWVRILPQHYFDVKDFRFSFFFLCSRGMIQSKVITNSLCLVRNWGCSIQSFLWEADTEFWMDLKIMPVLFILHVLMNDKQRKLYMQINQHDLLNTTDFVSSVSPDIFNKTFLKSFSVTVILT